MFNQYEQLYIWIENNELNEISKALREDADPNHVILREETDSSAMCCGSGTCLCGWPVGENITFLWHDSLLFTAIKNEKIEAVRLLVEAGADIENHCGRFSTTALGNALLLGYEEIALYLINRGANVNSIIQDIWWKPSPEDIQHFYHNRNISLLHLAVEKNMSVSLVQSMVSRQANLEVVAQYHPINFAERVAAEWCTNGYQIGANVILALISFGIGPIILFSCCYQCDPSTPPIEDTLYPFFDPYVCHTPLALAKSRGNAELAAVLEAPALSVIEVEPLSTLSNNAATLYSSLEKQNNNVSAFSIVKN